MSNNCSERNFCFPCKKTERVNFDPHFRKVGQSDLVSVDQFMLTQCVSLHGRLEVCRSNGENIERDRQIDFYRSQASGDLISNILS